MVIYYKRSILVPNAEINALVEQLKTSHKSFSETCTTLELDLTKLNISTLEKIKENVDLEADKTTGYMLRNEIYIYGLDLIEKLNKMTELLASRTITNAKLGEIKEKDLAANIQKISTLINKEFDVLLTYKKDSSNDKKQEQFRSCIFKLSIYISILTTKSDIKDTLLKDFNYLSDNMDLPEDYSKISNHFSLNEYREELNKLTSTVPETLTKTMYSTICSLICFQFKLINYSCNIKLDFTYESSHGHYYPKLHELLSKELNSIKIKSLDANMANRIYLEHILNIYRSIPIMEDPNSLDFKYKQKEMNSISTFSPRIKDTKGKNIWFSACEKIVKQIKKLDVSSIAPDTKREIIDIVLRMFPEFNNSAARALSIDIEYCRPGDEYYDAQWWSRLVANRIQSGPYNQIHYYVDHAKERVAAFKSSIHEKEKNSDNPIYNMATKQEASLNEFENKLINYNLFGPKAREYKTKVRNITFTVALSTPGTDRWTTEQGIKNTRNDHLKDVYIVQLDPNICFSVNTDNTYVTQECKAELITSNAIWQNNIFQSRAISTPEHPLEQQVLRHTAVMIPDSEHMSPENQTALATTELNYLPAAIKKDIKRFYNENNRGIGLANNLDLDKGHHARVYESMQPASEQSNIAREIHDSSDKVGDDDALKKIESSIIEQMHKEREELHDDIKTLVNTTDSISKSEAITTLIKRFHQYENNKTQKNHNLTILKRGKTQRYLHTLFVGAAHTDLFFKFTDFLVANKLFERIAQPTAKRSNIKELQQDFALVRIFAAFEHHGEPENKFYTEYCEAFKQNNWLLFSRKDAEPSLVIQRRQSLFFICDVIDQFFTNNYYAHLDEKKEGDKEELYEKIKAEESSTIQGIGLNTDELRSLLSTLSHLVSSLISLQAFFPNLDLQECIDRAESTINTLTIGNILKPFGHINMSNNHYLFQDSYNSSKRTILDRRDGEPRVPDMPIYRALLHLIHCTIGENRTAELLAKCCACHTTSIVEP